MESLRFHPVHPLKVSLPWFHGCWQKSRDSQVRDNGLYYSQHSKEHEHQHICSHSPCPQDPRGLYREASGMSYRRGKMKSYKMASREACLLSWSDTIFVFQVILSKPPSSPLLWRGNISVFQGCMPFQHPWEEQKITSAPACKINRHMRDHGELFPNNTLSRSFCLYISGRNYSIWPPLAAREAMKLGICG